MKVKCSYKKCVEYLNIKKKIWIAHKSFPGLKFCSLFCLFKQYLFHCKEESEK